MKKKENVKTITDVYAENLNLISIISLLNDKVKDAADYIEKCYSIYNESDGSVTDFGKHKLFSDVVVPNVCGSSKYNTTDVPFDSVPDCRGIYLFLLNESVSLSNDDVMKWNGKNYKPKKRWGADIKKQFIDSGLEEGQCFYVGSVSSGSCTLQKRMEDHYAESEIKTYSLKLNIADRAFMRDKLTVLLFPLKKKYEEQGIIILPLVEKELHARLSPVAGQSK